MDAADASASNSVMIALLPINADWCEIELPHMTLVYAGLKSDLTPTDFSNLAKDAAALASLTKPFYLRVAATEKFGDDLSPVHALRFQLTTELWAMRRYVERWNESEYPFNPHATIGPATGAFVENVPPVVGFDRVYLGWGDESLTFWMKSARSDY